MCRLSVTEHKELHTWKCNANVLLLGETSTGPASQTNPAQIGLNACKSQTQITNEVLWQIV